MTRDRWTMQLGVFLLLFVALAFTWPRTEAPEKPRVRIAVVAQGDTLKVSFWITRTNTDSFTVDVTTLPTAHGTKHYVFPGTTTSGLLNFIPAPKLVEGEAVTVHACFRAYHVTLLSGIICRDASPYVQPVTPPTITPDSLKVVGWIQDPPMDARANVTAIIGSEFTFCRWWVFADSGIAMRQIDMTPQCVERMKATYASTPTRVKMTLGLRQMLVDSKCVDYIVPGGNGGPNGTITLSGPTPCDRICDENGNCTAQQGLFRRPPSDQLRVSS